MRFGYLITVTLYALTSLSLGTTGCGPAYAHKMDPGQIIGTIAAGVDVVDSCVFGMTKVCVEQSTQPVAQCLFQRAKPCIEAVQTGTELVGGLLGWAGTFRRGGPGGSGAGDTLQSPESCLQMLDPSEAEQRCARSGPTRTGAECIAEGVARCLRLAGDVPLRVTVAEAPSPEASPQAPTLSESPALGEP